MTHPSPDLMPTGSLIGGLCLLVAAIVLGHVARIALTVHGSLLAAFCSVCCTLGGTAVLFGHLFAVIIHR